MKSDKGTMTSETSRLMPAAFGFGQFQILSKTPETALIGEVTPERGVREGRAAALGRNAMMI